MVSHILLPHGKFANQCRNKHKTPRISLAENQTVHPEFWGTSRRNPLFHFRTKLKKWPPMRQYGAENREHCASWKGCEPRPPVELHPSHNSTPTPIEQGGTPGLEAGKIPYHFFPILPGKVAWNCKREVP